MVLYDLLIAFNRLHFQQTICHWFAKGVFRQVWADF